jgi:hypothetical protein
VNEIKTLIPDIQELVTKKNGWFNDELSKDFAASVAKRVQDQFAEKKRTPELYLSQMGPRCPKALWHSIHTPDQAERLPPWAEIKYSFGHLIEALAITLAKASGHKVEGEQDAITVDGVRGRRDCVIDGAICDIKSSSSRSFQKFKDGSIAMEDSFGYLDQLDGYICGSLQDPLVTVKDRGYLLVVDKTLGHMVLYEHAVRLDSIRMRIKTYKEYVARDVSPSCTCGTVAEGKSGNIKLGTKASYSSYKYCCFPRLRTFIYASGPVYLTKVVRKPDVPEIDRYGNLVYA